ncbi:MAG: nitrous oxide reductase accessory protein NosL [Gammaproteobacteria bacterium]|nr:nitrous oxide reductase accessory protein NosL [Gammaproteobacteria bacterium]
MNFHKLPIFISLYLLVSVSILAENVETPQEPVAFEQSDRCHACGMMITPFPGPKGQAFEGQKKQKRTFCSTMDLMVWYLKSKNKPEIFEMFVHDMSKVPWKKPKDSHLIPAREAYYVIGSNMNGAMGPTLASFLSKEQADNFIKKHGGTISDFENLTIKGLRGH